MNDDDKYIPPKLLVLGGPASGKTTYRTQLYQRIEHQDGELKLKQSVKDMSALESDVDRLVQGLQPMHTSLNTYHSTAFDIEDRKQHEMTIEFADYDGEQAKKIGEANTVPSLWVERAKQASMWLLFLRIDQIRSSKSFMTDPVESASRSDASPETVTRTISGELNAIETLQRLLFVRGDSLRHQLCAPRLGIFLSCWDELAETERDLSPKVVLEQRVPLLSRFIAASWKPEQYKIWGLSSIEGKLSETTPDLEFARKGPANVGYIVNDGGSHSNDLTLPISWLMQPE